MAREPKREIFLSFPIQEGNQPLAVLGEQKKKEGVSRPPPNKEGERNAFVAADLADRPTLISLLTRPEIRRSRNHGACCGREGNGKKFFPAQGWGTMIMFASGRKKGKGGGEKTLLTALVLTGKCPSAWEHCWGGGGA